MNDTKPDLDTSPARGAYVKPAVTKITLIADELAAAGCKLPHAHGPTGLCDNPPPHPCSALGS